MPNRHIHLPIAGALLIGFALLLSLPPIANAQAHSLSLQAGDLTMQATPVASGTFKYGEWLPIWVQLENHGADQQAEVRVQVPDQVGATTYAAAVQLPGGSRKRLAVYVLPNNFSHELNVELVEAQSGKVLLSQKVDVYPQPDIIYLIGLIAPQRGGLTLLNNITLPGNNRKPLLIDLSLEELPDRSEGLRSFDALVLNDTDTSNLATEQSAALEAWVRQGGRLVIGGGAQALPTTAGLPASLLPFSPHTDQEVSELPGLNRYAQGQAVRVPGPFVLATGDPDGGTILAEQDGTPLIQEWTTDLGYVDFVALDLAASPFNAWAGTTAFWEALLSPGAGYPEWRPFDQSIRQMRANMMASSLSNLPALDLPSIRWLTILLIIYVILVGPANYVVLHWRRQLHLAWVTIPLITLAFSGGAFGLGYALRGTDIILNKIAIIEAQPDGSAEVDTYLGLFSPARQSYQVQVNGSELISPMNQQTDPFSGMPSNGSGGATFVQGEPGQVRNLTVNQWSMQAFMTESHWKDFGQIEAELQLEYHTLRGSVSNRTAYPIKDAVLIMGNLFTRLGDLQPGETRAVEMELPSLLGQPFDSLSWRLFQQQYDPTSPNGPPRAVQLKQSMLDNLFQGGGAYGPMLSIKSTNWNAASLTQALLLGWLDQAPPEIQVAEREPASQTTALLIEPLSYRLSSGNQISLPPGFLNGNVIEMNDAGYCGPMGMPAFYLTKQEIVYEYQVPARLPDESDAPGSDGSRLQVEKFILELGTPGDMNQPPVTDVYQWQTQTWVPLENVIFGRNDIPADSGIINPQGQVRLRFTPKVSNAGGCFYLSMGLEGVRLP